jgi:acyl carrier protein
MERADILQKVGEIVIDFFKLDDFVCHQSTAAVDISAWNSFSHLPLISKIEEAFSLRFSFVEVTDFQTLGDIADCIAQKTSAV